MNRLLVLTIVLLGLGACGGGDDTPPVQEPTVDFNQFVLDELDLTDVHEEPAEVNGIAFSFDEDETVFDSVL